MAVIIPYITFFAYFSFQSRDISVPKPRLSEEHLRKLGTLDAVVTAYIKSAEIELERRSKDRENTKKQIAFISKTKSLLGLASPALLAWAELIDSDEWRLELIQKAIIGELKFCNAILTGLREGDSRRALLENIRGFEDTQSKIRDMLQEAELHIKKTGIGIGINPHQLTGIAHDEWQILAIIQNVHESRIADQQKMHSDIVKFSDALKKLVEVTPPIYDTLRFPF